MTWSPSGKYCAAVSHDSQLHVINFTKPEEITCNFVQWKNRAFYRVCFGEDEQIFGCGFDRVPVLFTGKDGVYAEKAILDDSEVKVKAQGYMEQRINIFSQKELGKGNEDIEYLQIMKTKHRNTIM